MEASSAKQGAGGKPGAVTSLLEEYGGPVRRAVGGYLAGGPSCPLESLLLDYPARGGKALRPTLLVATAKVFGASLEEALPAAVALEILHNAQLVHDDIEDGSLDRRGGPALHREHGIPMALCVGDALAFRSLRPFLDCRYSLGDRTTLRLFEEAGRMMGELVSGQALELGWRDGNVLGVSEQDYLEMVLKKTCWLSTIFPLRAGALIGGRGEVDLEPFIRFGFFLGAAFQVRDDVLNLAGDEKAYGKEIDGDLWEGKRTLMLIRLFNLATDVEKARLQSIFATQREGRDGEDIAWVRRRMEALDCLGYAREFAHGLAGAALAEFDRLFANSKPSADLDMIGGLVHWVLGRAH